MTQRAVFLASYKGTHAGWQGWINRCIRWGDKSMYSHSEIGLGVPFDEVTTCMSSAGVDGGVRAKDMKLNPEKWDALPLGWLTEEQVRAHFDATQGRRYDYWGVGRFVLPFVLREHESRWFCSEWCAVAMGIDQGWRFTPGTLHVATAEWIRAHGAAHRSP
jgi:hypothetical protein